MVVDAPHVRAAGLKLGAHGGLALDELTEVRALDNVAAGVHGLSVLFVNIYGIRCETDAADWVLVDAGVPLSAWRIRRWAHARFGEMPPRAILLTHGHFDHTGALVTLADEWDVPVYAHRDEFPFLTGHQSYPAPDPSVGGGFMSRISPLLPVTKPIDVTERLCALHGEGGMLPASVLPGWRWLHTPGHTAGHVSFFREWDRTLIAGCALCNTKFESFFALAQQTPELHGPPAFNTVDWTAAKHSVDVLASLRPRTVAAGHGPCIAGPDVARKLTLFAADFERLAIPAHGKYVAETAPHAPA